LSDPQRVLVAVADAECFVVRVMRAYGVSAADAAVVAQCLLRADLRGVTTHGLMRLPVYTDRLRRRLVSATPDLVVTRTTSATASVNGGNALGFVVAHRAMSEAIALAREAGIGMVGARHSNHFGMAASYVLQATEAGLAAMVFTNASRAMPPWGGRVSLLGTSPLAFGVPGPNGGSIVLDMSPSVASRGKIRQAVRRGEQIPAGWALDADGAPTTDPAAALQGVVLPMGGPKGSGLSLFMDIFAGVLTGAAFGGHVGDQYKDFDRPQDVGHLFIALRPDLFVSAGEFASRIETLAGQIGHCPLAAGFDEILLPGEAEERAEARNRVRGVSYGQDDMRLLRVEAERARVEPLAVQALSVN
jgi:LDH2 family malate/lactate/ureidoglycolate dehydrogenase